VSDALKQLESLLGSRGVEVPRFPASSRYAATPTARLVRPDGREVVYLRRRLVPGAERFALQREHVVVAGDRLDVLAALYFGDAELFWRLCDANGALRPADLLAPIGRRLRITLPEGIPGASDA
jgi:hypothetical protein